MIKRKPLFTEKDWLTRCGHTRAEIFSSRLPLRFFNLLSATPSPFFRLKTTNLQEFNGGIARLLVRS
jgi:hypothetical protein